MRMHPIVPVPDVQITEPIAYAEGLDMLIGIPMPVDFTELMEQLGTDSDEMAETALLYLLGTGHVQSYVYSVAEKRWGRLPALFWAWHSQVEQLERGVFRGATTPMMGAGFGDYEPFIGSPVLLLRSHISRLVDDLQAERDSEEAPTVDSDRPATFATVAARARCTHWLREQFADDPDRNLVKKDLQGVAADIFLDLSGRQFEKAWAEATKDDLERRKAGRRPTTH